jgi:serine/threonine protein kinase
MDLSKRQTFPSGKVIGGYEIIFLIGIGGFGDVYKVKDRRTSQMFAMKTETIDCPQKSLPNEIQCIQSLQGDCFPRLRAHGTEKKCLWFVMNILGGSISAVRKQHGGKLPLKTALPIIREMLSIIERLHALGWLHRDIKPSNFLLQQNSQAPIVLIDYGLSKRHIDPETGNPFVPAVHARFAGTKKYSSQNADANRELGRRDDVISWFYSAVDICAGGLPWVDCGEDMAEKKRIVTEEELCAELPRQMIDAWRYIGTLQYQDKPKYGRIGARIDEAMAEAGCAEFDWAGFYAQHSYLGDLKRTAGGEEQFPGDGEGGCCGVA